jgi:hypothetical protein
MTEPDGGSSASGTRPVAPFTTLNVGLFGASGALDRSPQALIRQVR